MARWLLWLQVKPTLLSMARGASPGAPRTPRGGGGTGLPTSQRALKGRDETRSARCPCGQHSGDSHVGQSTVHDRDLPGDLADSLSRALPGHRSSSSCHFLNAHCVLAVSLRVCKTTQELPWLFQLSAKLVRGRDNVTRSPNPMNSTASGLCQPPSSLEY